MRLMAGVAGETTGVIGRYDLGKSRGLGAVGLVTSRTDDGGVGQLWLYRGRIVSVFALCSVASFAGNVGVTAQFLLVYDVGVAGFTDVMSGESWRLCSNFGNGVAAVMAVLAEALGNDGRAQQYEYRQKNCDDDGKADEMFDVLEHGCFPCAGRTEARKGAVILDTVYRSAER